MSRVWTIPTTRTEIISVPWSRHRLGDRNSRVLPAGEARLADAPSSDFPLVEGEPRVLRGGHGHGRQGPALQAAQRVLPEDAAGDLEVAHQASTAPHPSSCICSEKSGQLAARPR